MFAKLRQWNQAWNFGPHASPAKIHAQLQTSFHRLLSAERNDFQTFGCKVIGQLILRDKRTKCPSTAAAVAYSRHGHSLLVCRLIFTLPLSVAAAVIAKPLWTKPLLQITRPLAHCNVLSSIAAKGSYLYTCIVSELSLEPAGGSLSLFPKDNSPAKDLSGLITEGLEGLCHWHGVILDQHWKNQ